MTDERDAVRLPANLLDDEASRPVSELLDDDAVSAADCERLLEACAAGGVDPAEAVVVDQGEVLRKRELCAEAAEVFSKALRRHHGYSPMSVEDMDAGELAATFKAEAGGDG